MSGELWPCSACGEPGWRNLGSRGYCRRHLAELLASFDVDVFGMEGFGVQAGPMRPDHGPDDCELECVVCSARWVGVLLASCPWCAATLERMVGWQADIVLTAPEVDRDDARYDAVMKAWAGRLRVAVEAGIVSEHDADRAWQQAVRHAAC